MPILPDIPSLSEARYHLACCLENLQIRIFNQLMFSALRLLQFLNTTETQRLTMGTSTGSYLS